MRYAKIEYNSISNGPGIRVVLWFQGCSLHCKGCQNPETWDRDSGTPWVSSDIFKIYNELKKPWVRGLTFSGGHPLEYYNINSCMHIAEKVKENYPDKDIWLYTGYLWEDIKDLPIMKYIDVIVDGPYIEEQRNISLPYCGSNNQRVIDVKKSLQNKGVVLYETY